MAAQCHCSRTCGNYGCPGPASMSDLLLLGAYGDSGPHPQQYPPGLQLPKAGFNVGSAVSGGRWDSAVAMAREPEAAMAAQGQLQCWIC